MSLNELIGAQYKYTQFFKGDIETLTSLKIMDNHITIQPMTTGCTNNAWVITKKGFENNPFVFNSLTDLNKIFCEFEIITNSDNYNDEFGKSISLFKEKFYDSLISELS